MRETPNLSTNADRSINILLLKKNQSGMTLCFKALRVGPQMHQPTSQTPPTRGPSNVAIWNNSLFLRVKRVDWRVHQSTNRTPPTHGRSMYAIQNNSSFWGLYELVDECTCPLVKHIPWVDLPCMQSRTAPQFKGSTSWSTSAPVHQSNSCHACRNSVKINVTENQSVEVYLLQIFWIVFQKLFMNNIC